MNSSMTSAGELYDLLPLGFSDRMHKTAIMEKACIDEAELRCGCSDLIQKGLALIFHDDQGSYYLPKNADEILEFGTRHPQDLKFQLACFCKGHFAFHQRG